MDILNFHGATNGCAEQRDMNYTFALSAAFGIWDIRVAMLFSDAWHVRIFVYAWHRECESETCKPRRRRMSGGAEQSLCDRMQQ